MQYSQTWDQSQKAQTAVLSYLLLQSTRNCDYSIYAEVGCQALDCPFKFINLPLLSCSCLRQRTALLHRASLPTTIAERWPTLPLTTFSLRPGKWRKQRGLKLKSTGGEKILGKVWYKCWFAGCSPSVGNHSPPVFVWDYGMVKTELWLSSWKLYCNS